MTYKVFVGSKELKVVESFTYLGCVLSDDAGMDEEISSRIQKASFTSATCRMVTGMVTARNQAS